MSDTLRPTASEDEQRPDYNCPTCDRPTLGAADAEIVAWRCGVCGQRVTETGGEEQ